MALPQCTQKSLTNQLDFLSKKVLPFLMRHLAAKPFLKPVDFISFGLPDYPDIIKNPMDLGTIKDRLLRKFYASSKDCIRDLNLMFQNCYIYNGPGDIIITKGLQLQQQLLIKLKLMPKEEIKISKISKFHSLPLNRRNRPNIPEKIPKLAIKSMERMKPDKYLMLSSDFDKCLSLINELMSSKYKHSNHLFLKSVDIKTPGLPDFYDMARGTLDLVTIKHNLDNDKYKDKTLFLNDIYLMINNCLVFNGPGSAIGVLCKHFQNDFENLFFTIFKEKCFDSANDDAFYFLMRVMRRHKDIEELIRCNSDKIAHSRQRIDMIVNILEDSSIIERKRKKETGE